MSRRYEAFAVFHGSTLRLGHYETESPEDAARSACLDKWGGAGRVWLDFDRSHLVRIDITAPGAHPDEADRFELVDFTPAAVTLRREGEASALDPEARQLARAASKVISDAIASARFVEATADLYATPGTYGDREAAQQIARELDNACGDGDGDRDDLRHALRRAIDQAVGVLAKMSADDEAGEAGHVR